MDQTTQSADWIDAYLEWTGAEAMERSATSEREFPVAYVEWLEASLPVERVTWRASPSVRGRRASDAIAGMHGFREAVLLAAMHAQSDCLHILRQILDQGSANVGTVRLAAEALEHAQRLMDDERLAWHALSELHGNGQRRATDAWRSSIGNEWPQALEHVASDVRQLTSTVLALQFH